MPFDIDAARKSGKSDADIATYLGNSLGFDVDAALKSGKTHKQIAEYLATNERPVTQPKATPTPLSGESTIDMLKQHLGNLAANAPGDAWDVLKSTISSLVHPVNTLKGMGEFAAGGVSAGLRAIDPGANAPVQPGETAFRNTIINPIAESIKNPAGIPGRIGKYTEKHPVGQLMNLSGALGIAGKVSDIAALTRAAEFTNPLSLLAKPAAAGVNALANKLTSSGLTAESIKNLKIAQATGVPLTAADITGKKTHAIMEMQLKDNIGSASIAEAATDAKAIAVQNYVEKLKANMGGQMDKLSAGQITQEAANKFYKVFQTKASRLYSEIPIHQNELVTVNHLSQVAAENAEELGRINNASLKRILSTVRTPEVDVGTGQSNYLWKELIADQQELRKMATATGDFNKKRIYMGMVSAINEDISDFAKATPKTEVRKTLDAAVNFYREGDANLPGIKTFRDRQIANMMRTSSPEDIVNNFVKASPNLSDLQRLREVAGPKGWNAIKRAWLQGLTTQGQEQSFSPAKFATSYDKYRQGGNLKILLNRDERAGLDKLYSVSKIINSAEKIAGNPSGTGRMYMNAAMHWVAHPVIQTITQISANRMAELYFNNPGFKRFLIEGLNAESKSAKAINAASAMAKIASQSAATNAAFQAQRAQPQGGMGVDRSYQNEYGNLVQGGQ